MQQKCVTYLTTSVSLSELLATLGLIFSTCKILEAQISYLLRAH